MLWCLFIPLFYIVTMIFLYGIFCMLRLIKHHKIYFYNGSVFILMFLQPNIVGIFISASFCREINDKSYIKEDIRYECYNETHVTFLFSLILPAFVNNFKKNFKFKS